MSSQNDEIEYARELTKLFVNDGLTLPAVASKLNDSKQLDWDYFHDRGAIYGKRNEDDPRPVNIYQVAPK